MDPNIALALWTALGLIGAALVTGIFGVVSTRRRLGKPNGNGDIATMLGNLLEHVGELRGELREHADQDQRVQSEIFERLEAMK